MEVGTNEENSLHKQRTNSVWWMLKQEEMIRSSISSLRFSILKARMNRRCSFDVCMIMVGPPRCVEGNSCLTMRFPIPLHWLLMFLDALDGDSFDDNGGRIVWRWILLLPFHCYYFIPAVQYSLISCVSFDDTILQDVVMSSISRHDPIALYCYRTLLQHRE